MNHFLTIFLEYKITNLLCVDYIVLLPGKTLSNYTNLFSPNEYKKNDKIISILKLNISSLKFRSRNINEIRNYLLDEMKNNDLIGEKYKKTSKYLNYFEHLLILVSTVTSCVSISAFVSLVFAPVGIASSKVRINLCAITAGIKRYK